MNRPEHPSEGPQSGDDFEFFFRENQRRRVPAQDPDATDPQLMGRLPAPPAPRQEPMAHTQPVPTDPSGWEDSEAWDPEPRRSGIALPVAIIVGSFVLLAGVAVFLLGRHSAGGTSAQSSHSTLPSATSSSSPGSSSHSSSSSTPSSTPTSSSSSSSSSSSASTLPAAAVTTCSPKVGGGPKISCPFARNVASAVAKHGDSSQPFTVHAHSPVTGKDYTLNCSKTTYIQCVTNTGSIVYLAG